MHTLNLTLNTTKSVEILFTDKYRKCQFNPPSDVPEIDRVSSIRILGVTLTNKLSVSDHIHNVIQDCAPILYALRILRSHGMNQSALQTVYHSVVISKLLYAAPAWWSFSTSTDRNSIAGFVNRGARRGFCTARHMCVTLSSLESNSWSNFWVFHPTDAAHCTDQGEIWQGGADSSLRPHST